MDSVDELSRNAPIADVGLSAAVHERWAVKTGADPNALITDLSPVSTSLAALIALPAPEGLAPDSPRQPGPESTIYEVSATLTAYKLESDKDFHLVLSDANHNTMIVEIPDPAVLDPESIFKQEIASARKTFAAKFQRQIQALRDSLDQLQRAASALGTQATVVAPMIAHVDIPVVVDGVGFFDFPHGQYGAAPNQFELHPVLSIKFG